jgi:hypothetical protein
MYEAGIRIGTMKFKSIYSNKTLPEPDRGLHDCIVTAYCHGVILSPHFPKLFEITRHVTLIMKKYRISINSYRRFDSTRFAAVFKEEENMNTYFERVEELTC